MTIISPNSKAHRRRSFFLTWDWILIVSESSKYPANTSSRPSAWCFPFNASQACATPMYSIPQKWYKRRIATLRWRQWRLQTVWLSSWTTTAKRFLTSKDVAFEDNKVYQQYGNQKMNDYLKELAELKREADGLASDPLQGKRAHWWGYAFKYALLGTYAGRRTFICNALALGIPPQVVMKWTGHSDYKAMKLTLISLMTSRRTPWASSIKSTKTNMNNSIKKQRSKIHLS